MSATLVAYLAEAPRRHLTMLRRITLTSQNNHENVVTLIALMATISSVSSLARFASSMSSRPTISRWSSVLPVLIAMPSS